MSLFAEQLDVLASYFAGAIETFAIMPKKNGKSTLMAALAIYHLLVTPDAECIIVAASRDQAQIPMDQLRDMILRNPDLQARMRVLRREVVSLDDGGVIRVLASDEDTADGVLPSLAIVDELHRHKTADLYGVLRLGLGPRKGAMLTISTAGALGASPLGVLRSRAHEMSGFVRDEARKYNHVRSADGTFAFHEWCLSPSDDVHDDVHDMEVVKLANPAPWRDVATLQAEHDSPMITPWQWLRFCCGIWTEGEEPWIPAEAWDVLATPGLEIPVDVQAWLGVDLGLKHDSTGIAAAALMPDGTVAVKCKIINPATEEITLTRVEGEIRDLKGVYSIAGVAFDPWSFRRSAELLEAEGLNMVEVPQTDEQAVAFTSAIREAVITGRLRHDGDPALRAHVMAGRLKETPRGARLVKDPKRRATDALMAMAMAVYLALANLEPELKPWFGFA